MPRLLRKDSIRLLEASVDNLFLANVGLAIPRKDGQHRRSGEIGLVGAASELAMSALLVEAFGSAALLKSSSGNQYKSGQEILRDCRQLLRSATPNTSFLIQDVPAPTEHRNKLFDSTTKFTLLIAMRAGGLHAGKGHNHDVVCCAIDDVTMFLNTLCLSTRMRPYLSSVPEPTRARESRVALVEDIARQINKTGTNKTVSNLLHSAFMVLPDIPSQEPDWLSALERISVAPKKHDISFLLDILSNALPVVLAKRADTGSYVSVRVEPNNPAALPIAPALLRKSFTQLKDHWHAQVGISNGKLDKGEFDVPKIQDVLDLFVSGLDEAEISDHGATLPFVETWPYIAASLNASGTPLPYWFLIRRTDNLGQLRAHLAKAANSLAAKLLKERLSEASEGMKCIEKGSPLLVNSDLRGELLALRKKSELCRTNLLSTVSRNRGGERDSKFELERDISEIIQSDSPLEDILFKLASNEYALDETALLYWTTKIVEASGELEDKGPLVEIYKNPQFKRSRTSVRKALRLIDFWSYGPSID